MRTNSDLPELPDGLYESLVSRKLRTLIERAVARGRQATEKALDVSDSDVLLARALAAEVQFVLKGVSAEDVAATRATIFNSFLAFLRERFPHTSDVGDELALPPRLLKAVGPLGDVVAPATSIAISNLFTGGGHRSVAIGHELKREFASADRVDAIISFVRNSGLRVLFDDVERHAQAGRSFRLLTTTYCGATEAFAIERLARLPGVEVRVSYNTDRTRLHAKAWLFHRESGYTTAYVGSANLSHAALIDGHEWMVKLAAMDVPHVIEAFRAEFDTLWADEEFKPFDVTSEAQCSELRRALDREHAPAGAGSDTFFDLRPYDFQQEILDRLRAEREVGNHWRNLVVAATGTGKTVIAAFDYKAQIGADGLRPRLLFLAHREEILVQAQATFRQVLRDHAFGELLVGGREPSRYDHLFASVQSVTARDLIARMGAEHWEYVVVDECHHVPADSYQALVTAVRPRILLGLTATPERQDGRSLQGDFGHRIAAEMRLWHAIERQLLVPFEYFGISDGVDLTQARWSRGAYEAADLDRLYTGDDRRVALVLDQVRRRVGDVSTMRALGFCVSVQHAQFMATRFAQAGIPALAVVGSTDDATRRTAREKLERRDVNVVFTCDLYNEGVDLPWVDTLLLLRPTSSSTLFLQQLGRGLRKHEVSTPRGPVPKTSCLVLDFIGQHREEFRFDVVLGALTGLPRARLQKAVEQDFPTLPSGCTLSLDKVASDQILKGLRRALRGGLRELTNDYLRLRASGRIGAISLAAFLEETGRSLDEVYKAGGWTAILLQAGAAGPWTAEEEATWNADLGRLEHVDDPETLDLLEAVLAEPALVDALHPVERRRLLMVGYRLERSKSALLTPEQVADRLTRYPRLAAEALELSAILRGRIGLARAAQVFAAWPLSLHRHYHTWEILTAVGRWTEAAKPFFAEGVLSLPSSRTEVLLVTLRKTEEAFSATTRYDDYAISPRLFHWQTQNRVSPTSETGRKYIEQAENGWQFLLFARETKNEAYAFLGPVHFVSTLGSRPMSITWSLEHAMPAALFEAYTASAA